jgi:hydrogenase maturation protease
MQDLKPSRIVTVGVGNIVRSDDGLGVHAMLRVLTDSRTPPEVVFIDGGTLGLELVSYVSGATHLLLLDSVDSGRCPGTLIRVTGEELRSLPCGASVHQLGVADLIATLSLASEEPPDILLLGIQPASTEWGTTLTPEVEAALGALVDMAIAELRSWSNRGAEIDVPVLTQPQRDVHPNSDLSSNNTRTT